MKRGSLHILFFLFFIAASSSAVVAQDAGMSDVEMIDETSAVNEEITRFVPGEGVKYVPRTLTNASVKDSLVLHMNDFPMQQATLKAPAQGSEKQSSSKQKDESILTFNFLYYIIQKYKLQDIID